MRVPMMTSLNRTAFVGLLCAVSCSACLGLRQDSATRQDGSPCPAGTKNCNSIIEPAGISNDKLLKMSDAARIDAIHQAIRRADANACRPKTVVPIEIGQRNGHWNAYCEGVTPVPDFSLLVPAKPEDRGHVLKCEPLLPKGTRCYSF